MPDAGRRRIAAAVCCLLLAAPLLIRAPETRAASVDEIYVAGSTDNYPLEYYDRQAGEFRGFFPALLEEISEDTGMEFRYVEPSSKEEQVRNLQADLVSDVTGADLDAWDLEDAGRAVSIGDGETAGFAFTEIFPQADRDAFTQAAARAAAEHRDAIFLSLLREERAGQSPWSLASVIACGALLALSAVLAVLLARQRKRHAAALEHMALRDPVTGFGNLRLLAQEAPDHIPMESCTLYYAADFETENLPGYRELFGEEAGDRFLTALAGALKGFADSDSLFAVSGQRICLLLKCDSPSALREKLSHMLEDAAACGREDAPGYPFRFRIGVSQLSPSDSGTQDALTRAVQARHAASQRDVGFVEFESLGSELERSRRLEQELLSDFRCEEFHPFYQSQIDLRTGRIAGMEALCRWFSRSEGFLPPGRFIPILEQNRMIDRLDLWIFEQTCRIISQRTEQGKLSVPVSCNFSRYCFTNPDLPEDLQKIAQKYKTPARLLCIEITESVLETDGDQAAAILKRLHSLGFLISLDDFGTGYASFHDLDRYPIDFLKIDKSLLESLEDPKTSPVLKGMIDMAHSLGIRVICEGVESREAEQLLLSLGCDMAQGYLYGYAQPEEDLDAMFEEAGNA